MAAGWDMAFSHNSWQAHFDNEDHDHAAPQMGYHGPRHAQATAQPSWMSTVRDGRIAKADTRGAIDGRSKRRTGGTAAALVREGEVVGAKAGPIDSNSIGRRLMTKMGWSEGTALGKHRNGRLAPIEQVMRFSYTKAGLQ